MKHISLHLFLAALGTICGSYALASVLPWWAAVVGAMILVGGVSVLKEYRWDAVPDLSDLIADTTGITLGFVAANVIYPHILPGSYGVPWVGLFGIVWIGLNLAGMVPPMKKGG